MKESRKYRTDLPPGRSGTRVRRAFRLTFIALGMGALVALHGCSHPAESSIRQGREYLESGETERANAAFQQAADTANHDSGVITRIARAYAEANQLPAAVEWMIAAYESDPTSGHAQLLLGLAVLSGEVDAACDALSGVPESYPDDGRAINDYVYVCLVERSRDLDRAITLLERAVMQTRRSGMVVDSLGWAYFRRYQETGSREALNRAISLLEEAVALTSAASMPIPGGALSPGEEIRQHLIEAYGEMSPPQTLTPALRHHWAIQDALGAALLGERFIRPTRYGSAIILLEDSVWRNPKDSLVRFHLARAYLIEGKRDAAYVELRRSLELDPRRLEARQLLERHFRNGSPL